MLHMGWAWCHFCEETWRPVCHVSAHNQWSAAWPQMPRLLAGSHVMFTEQSCPPWRGHSEPWPFVVFDPHGYDPLQLGLSFCLLPKFLPCTPEPKFLVQHPSVQFLVLLTALHLNNITLEACLGLPVLPLAENLMSRAFLCTLLSYWAWFGQTQLGPRYLYTTYFPRPSHVALAFGTYTSVLELFPWPSALCLPVPKFCPYSKAWI